VLSRELVLRRHLRALLLGVCAMTGILLLALAGVPRRSRKDGIGAANVPVTFGGATFQPGGTIWCDADGIVTAPPQS